MLARFTDNPIARAEWTYLRRQDSVRWRRTHLLLFALALVAAVTPLWLYMDMSQSAALLIMTVMIYLAHIVVAMRTLLLAIDSIARERRSGAWDTLMLTGIDARRIVWGKWWAVVRYVWKDHALMALPRVGLAFGLAQHLHFSWMGSFLPNTPFVYFSYGYPAPDYINPQVTTTMIGAAIIIAYSLFEAGFITAFGLSSLLSIKSSTIASVSVAIIQKVLLVATVVMMLKLPFVYYRWYYDFELLLKIHCEVSASCDWNDYLRMDEDTTSEVWTAARTITRVLETVQLSISPLLDNGTLLAANIMRPVGEGSSFGVVYEQVGEAWKPVFKGNLLFVLRNLVAVMLGIVLHALIIRCVLRLAQAAAVRRHGALRPVG